MLPQPFGGLRAAGQNASADDPIYQTGKLNMLIDPGYRTLDWFVSNGMSPELKLSGSFDGGVSNILRTVSQQVGFDHGTGSLEFDQVEEGLSSGKINLGFKVIYMAPYQKLAVDAAKREIAAFLGRIDMNKARLSRVLLAGGGAKLYEKALKDRLPGYTIECMSDMRDVQCSRLLACWLRSAGFNLTPCFFASRWIRLFHEHTAISKGKRT